MAAVDPIDGPWDLPEGWEWQRLSAVSDVPERGDPRAKFASAFSYLDVSGIDQGRLSPRVIPVADAPSRARQILQANDSVISGVRIYLRNFALIEEGGPDVASTAFCVLRPRPKIDPKYLFYWVGSDQFIQRLLPLQRGNSPPAVLDADIRDQPIPVPPLAAQRRIVTRIQGLLSEIEEGESALAEARARLDTYRKSLLNAAVAGALTYDWRRAHKPCESGQTLLVRIRATHNRANGVGKRKTSREASLTLDEIDSDLLPTGWGYARFDEVLSILSDRGIKIKERDYTPVGKFPVIDQGAKPIAAYTDDAKMVQQHVSPVIIFGDHTRRFKYIDFPFCVGADGVKMMAPHPLMSPRFLFRVLEASRFEDRGYSRHFQFVRELKLPIPSKEEQDEIVAISDETLTQANEFERGIREQQSYCAALRQSILSSAFRGELVA